MNNFNLLTFVVTTNIINLHLLSYFLFFISHGFWVCFCFFVLFCFATLSYTVLHLISSSSHILAQKSCFLFLFFQ